MLTETEDSARTKIEDMIYTIFGDEAATREDGILRIGGVQTFTPVIEAWLPPGPHVWIGLGGDAFCGDGRQVV
jgi:hypothetical protein